MISTKDGGLATEPSRTEWLWVIGLATLSIVVTRWPAARLVPIESDEFGYLEIVQKYVFPPHHTLFLASGRALGELVGDPYRGFLLASMVSSIFAIVATYWWLRALVRPTVAFAAVALLGCGPIFWAYGALAANYTAIVGVGSFLLATLVRKRSRIRNYLAAVVLAIGTGYRQDIGTLWLPIFLVILFRSRWKGALGPLLVFTLLNIAWLSAMLWSVGGLANYRAITADFARSAGYMNSVFYLGVIDAPVRYSIKIIMALLGILGIALLFVPRGAVRLGQDNRFLLGLLGLSILPAMTFHLFIHFGVAGYAMHYVPALLALVAIGIGRIPNNETENDQTPARLMIGAILSATFFLFYPTDYAKPGVRGDIDLAFARHTRVGLRLPIPGEGPRSWRTKNSAKFADKPVQSEDRQANRF